MQEKEIVDKARQGDLRAYGMLVERYERAVFATVFSIMGDRHAAEDVTQDVFILGYQKVKLLRDPTRFPYWLLKVARREAVRAAKRQGRRRVLPITGTADPPDADANSRLLEEDDLFRLQPPDGYGLKEIDTGWSDYQSKLSAKMSHLATACHHFRSKHDGQFPKELTDLKTAGIKEEVLKVVLAAPDEPEGPAVIRYRRPPAGTDFSTCIMLHEAFDKWPKDGLVTCFADGHREIIADQKHFEQLLR